MRFDDLLTDEEKTVRQSVRDWVEEKYLPARRGALRGGDLPGRAHPARSPSWACWARTCPDEYGCAGIGDVAYGLAMQELERGDSGLRSFASVQGALVMYPIFAFGSEEQRAHWLPQLAQRREDRLLRPDRARLRLRPRRHDHARDARTDGYVLNGAKMWITNGTVADVAVVWAKLERPDDPRLPGREGHEGLQRRRSRSASTRCAPR